MSSRRHERGIRLRPHTGSVGNAKGDSCARGERSRVESIHHRESGGAWTCQNDRRSTGHYAQRPQHAAARLAATVGRSSLMSDPGGPGGKLTRTLSDHSAGAARGIFGCEIEAVLVPYFPTAKNPAPT